MTLSVANRIAKVKDKHFIYLLFSLILKELVNILEYSLFAFFKLPKFSTLNSGTQFDPSTVMDLLKFLRYPPLVLLGCKVPL